MASEHFEISTLPVVPKGKKRRAPRGLYLRLPDALAAEVKALAPRVPGGAATVLAALSAEISVHTCESLGKLVISGLEQKLLDFSAGAEE